mmetsp:Transcript_1970/g.3584  ORF Transcript_1970/g.3584 Transcript_1970/m.3584 type:complete len:259 (+) Transcript_1970:239-1015(+)
MTSTMASKSLLKVLTTPCKLANALDWRKMSGSTILSLDIHADRIGLAMASHPSGVGFSSKQKDNKSQSCHALEPIPLSSKKISAEAKQRLADLVKEYKVCGFVVSWPLQKDTGRMGASCGRTLFTLEQLLQVDDESSSSSSNNIVTPNRPIVLWDSQHVQPTQVDEFGRSPVFANTSSKTSHLASQEQYHQDQNVVATQVWQDFCKTYWPEPANEQQQQEKTAKKPSLVGGRKRTTVGTASSWQDQRQSSTRTALVAA